MTVPVLLLCTLSRALCDTDAAHAWARSVLESYLKGIAPYMVINGGAEKGDRDATLLGHAFGIPSYEYRTDGRIYAFDLKERLYPLRRWRNEKGSAHPLERNRYLVSRCVRGREAGWRVRVLGLVAPWSRTHGTDYTLDKARDAGFGDEEITRVQCPAEHGGALHG